MIPNILSLILLTPVVGLALLFLIPSQKTDLIRKVSFWATFIPFALSVYVFASYNPYLGGYQFIEMIPWVTPLGISYHLGVDGINSMLLVLLGVASFTSVMVSGNIKDRIKEYFIMLMLIVIGTYGAFLSVDMFFFYFFHEIAAIPVFLMIAIYGSQRRDYAAMKLTLYLTAGASLALIGLIALYLKVGIGSFDLIAIQEHLVNNPIPIAVQHWIFPLIVIGFGITLTLFPFHTWAPVGYAEAPTAVSMLHAGVLKKMGAYAIIRFAIQLMPEAAHTWMPIIAVLAVVNILFCGLVALTQRDIKYILGYSSCSHMGYILLGLACYNVIGLNGVVFMMFAHGIMATLAFALTGFIENQTKTRNLDELGGIAKRLPFISTCFIMVALASAGVPGFANFVSELLVLLGAWDQYRWLTVLGVLGIVLGAIYMLKIIRLALQGPLGPGMDKLVDAKGLVAKFPYVLLLGILIWVGCFPSTLIKHIETSTKPVAVILQK